MARGLRDRFFFSYSRARHLLVRIVVDGKRVLTLDGGQSILSTCQAAKLARGEMAWLLVICWLVSGVNRGSHGCDGRALAGGLMR